MYIPLGENNRLKLFFTTLGYADHYEVSASVPRTRTMVSLIKTPLNLQMFGVKSK